MINSRKKLIVDKDLQYRIIKYLVVYSTLLSLGFLAILYAASNRFIDQVAEMNVDQQIMISLFNDINYMAIGFFILIILISFISSYFSLFFSNKIAGPIYNMKQTLEQNEKDGTQKLIKLRSDDYFFSLAEKINVLIEKKN